MKTPPKQFTYMILIIMLPAVFFGGDGDIEFIRAWVLAWFAVWVVGVIYWNVRG